MKMWNTHLLLLSAVPPPMQWANRSSAHDLEGGIFVKSTQNVIVPDVPSFYFLPLFFLI